MCFSLMIPLPVRPHTGKKPLTHVNAVVKDYNSSKHYFVQKLSKTNAERASLIKELSFDGLCDGVSETTAAGDCKNNDFLPSKVIGLKKAIDDHGSHIPPDREPNIYDIIYVPILY